MNIKKLNYKKNQAEFYNVFINTIKYNDEILSTFLYHK